MFSSVYAVFTITILTSCKMAVGLLVSRFPVPCRNSRVSSQRRLISMRWQSVSSSLEVPASADDAFDLFKELNRHPEWSPWLREVESDESSGSSNWVLATRGVTVDWHARITAMESGQRIAWEATSGFPNRGEVRVFVLLTMGF
mmetsp:Transcript_79682/g.159099  ORF Transcript_79682/g.159099 Transcript_79682/m.159099 type:complete len:144 (-) Transcript_79682:230-661(-)